MKITLSPMRSTVPLEVSRAGDVLTINGETFNFACLPNGATLPRAAVACDWLASDVKRVGGELHLTLIVPHGANAPEKTLFPAPITVTADGPVAVPHYDAEDAA